MAGGTGTRMNLSSMPKQFLPLGDKPILIHTVERYLMNKRIGAVILGVHADWVEYTNELLEQHLPVRQQLSAGRNPACPVASLRREGTAR